MNYLKPRGTEDIYADIDLINWIENTLISTVKLFNFKEVRTPTFENEELFSKSVGDNTDIVSKEMFFLEKKSKKTYVLKPEGTAPIARFIIENKLYSNNPLPLKLFYLQTMYRYERPQNGRLRQFNQFGVEVIGENNYLIDVETIILATILLDKLNINNYTIFINSLGNIDTQLIYTKNLAKIFQNYKLCPDCTLRLKKNVLRILDCKLEKFSNLPKIYDFLNQDEKNNLDNTILLLQNLGIKVVLDHNLVRGLDYYTNVIFEIIKNNDKNKNLTLIGGGRYNNLIKRLGGSDQPAFGFAIGIERIKMLLVDEYNKRLIKSNKLDVFFILLNENAGKIGVKLCKLLRENNFVVDMIFDYTKTLKQQFKFADKFIIKNIIIIGDNEIKNDTVTVKKQNIKQINEIKIDDLLAFISKE